MISPFSCSSLLLDNTSITVTGSNLFINGNIVTSDITGLFNSLASTTVRTTGGTQTVLGNKTFDGVTTIKATGTLSTFSVSSSGSQNWFYANKFGCKLYDITGQESIDVMNRKLSVGANYSLDWWNKTLSGNWQTNTNPVNSGDIINKGFYDTGILNLSGELLPRFVSAESSVLRKDASTYSNIGITPQPGRLFVEDGTSNVVWQLVNNDVTSDSSWNGLVKTDASGNLSGKYFPRSLTYNQYTGVLLDSGELAIIDNSYLASSNGITNKSLSRETLYAGNKVDIKLDITNTTTIERNQSFTIVRSGDTAGQIYITPPDVSQSSGQFFTINTTSGVNSLPGYHTVVGLAESASRSVVFDSFSYPYSEYMILAGNNFSITWYSDGSKWFPISYPSKRISIPDVGVSYSYIDDLGILPVATGLADATNYINSYLPNSYPNEVNYRNNHFMILFTGNRCNLCYTFTGKLHYASNNQVVI